MGTTSTVDGNIRSSGGPPNQMQDVHANGVQNNRGERASRGHKDERGDERVSPLQSNDTVVKEDERDDIVAHSVVFLLHPGQPLSYITSLVQAEYPDQESELTDVRVNSSHKDANIKGHGVERRIGLGYSHASADPMGTPAITFHTCAEEDKHWSPSTGIGDFLREAARLGSFTIRIGQRAVPVQVPSFEDRTRFLRAFLRTKTAKIERLAKVKGECDCLAKRSTQRVAFAGAGVLGLWWVSVGVLTFREYLYLRLGSMRLCPRMQFANRVTRYTSWMGHYGTHHIPNRPWHSHRGLYMVPLAQ